MSFSAAMMTFLLGCLLMSMAIIGRRLGVRDVKVPVIGMAPRALSLGFGTFLVLLALVSPEVIESTGRSADAAGNGGSPQAGWAGGRAHAATGGGARTVTITDELGTEQNAERVEIWTDGRMVAVLEVNRRKRRDAVTLVLDNAAQGYLMRGYSQYNADGQLVHVELEGAGTIDPRISLAYEASMIGLDPQGGRGAATLRPR
jgi:hypothetical protein